MKVRGLVIIGSMLEYLGAVLVWTGVLYAGLSLVMPGREDTSAIIVRIVFMLFATLCAVAYFCWIMVKWFVWANSKTTNTVLLYTTATTNGFYLLNDQFVLHFASLADRQRVLEIKSRVRSSEETGKIELEVDVPIVYKTSILVPMIFRVIWIALIGELLYLGLRDDSIVFAVVCGLLIVYVVYRMAKIAGQPTQHVILDREGIAVDSVVYSWSDVSNPRTDIVPLNNRYFFCFDVGSETIRINTLVMNADALEVLTQATMLSNQFNHNRT